MLHGILRCRWRTTAVGATSIALLSCGLALAEDQDSDDAHKARTATPIKHVIILIGENEAVRRAIQNSQESLRGLAKRYGINQKTVAKWKQRDPVADLPTGPKRATSTLLSIEEEAIIVAFRRHTLLSLDDCLYALQPTIPHLTRSSLHRCLKRHGISRLPEIEGNRPSKKRFKAYPIGYFHVDIAEVQTAEGKLYLYVAIDRTSKFAFVQLVRKTARTWRSSKL